MNTLLTKIRSSEKIKKLTFHSIIVFMTLYVFSIPSFGSRDQWNYIMYFIMVILGLLVVVYSFLYQKPKINRWTLPIPFFAVFSIIGAIMYSHQYRSVLTLFLLVFSFFILYYCFSIINNKKLILSLFSFALFGFYLYYFVVYRNQILDFEGYINGNVRLGTYFDNQNAISAFSIIGYLISLYCLLFFKKHYRWIFVLPILTSIVVGISTGSRTFVVAFIVATIVVTFFKFKKHILIYFLFLVIFASIIVIVFSMPFMTTLRERFIRVFWTFFTDSSRVDTSTLGRITWLDYGFYIGNKHLLLGTGPYGFGVLSGLDTYTHSNFSEVWCDFGLIGFVLFYAPLFICLIKSFVTKNNNNPLVVSVFVYYMLVSFSNVFYYFKFYYFILAFIYYLSFDSQNDKSNVKIESISDYCKSIVFTCDGMESGGAEKVIVALSNEFANKGFKVTIIGVSTHNTESFYKLDDRVDYITLHNGSEKRIRFFKRVRLLKRTIKALKPDVVISFLPHVNVYTYYATIGMKMPVIVSERNNPKVDPKGFLLRRLKNNAFYQADGAVFQTAESSYYYRKSIRDKSVVVHNPVEPKLLNVQSNSVKNKVVLSVGRLTEQKNFICLIDAFALFSNNHEDYILRIYGEGHLHDELLEYAKEKGIGDKFELLSPDSSWQEKEKDDAMFILSSDYEGMPNALLEAMCIGIPCISTDCPSGGPYELIKDGENGFLVKVGDSIQTASKMEEILKTNFEFDLDEYRNRFAIDTISNEWLNYIKQVMEIKLSS